MPRSLTIAVASIVAFGVVVCPMAGLPVALAMLESASASLLNLIHPFSGSVGRHW